MPFLSAFEEALGADGDSGEDDLFGGSTGVGGEADPHSLRRSAAMKRRSSAEGQALRPLPGPPQLSAVEEEGGGQAPPLGTPSTPLAGGGGAAEEPAGSWHSAAGPRLYMRLVLGRQKHTSHLKRERSVGAASFNQVGQSSSPGCV